MRESEYDLYGQQQMGENAGWDSLNKEECVDTREYSDDEVRQLWEKKALEIAEKAVRNEGESIEDFRNRVNDMIPTIEEFRTSMGLPQAAQKPGEVKPAPQPIEAQPQPADQPTAEAQPAAGDSQENKENSDTTLHGKLVAALNRQEFADYLGDIDLKSLEEKDKDGNFTHSNDELILAVRKVRTAYQQALIAKFAARRKAKAAENPSSDKKADAKPAEDEPTTDDKNAEKGESKDEEERKKVITVLKNSEFTKYVEGIDVDKIDEKDESGNYIYSTKQLAEANVKAAKRWQEERRQQFAERHKNDKTEAKTPEEKAIAEARVEANAKPTEDIEKQKEREDIEHKHNELSRILRSEEIRPLVEGIDFNKIDDKDENGNYFYSNDQLQLAANDAQHKFQAAIVEGIRQAREARQAEAEAAAKKEGAATENAENKEGGEGDKATTEKIGAEAVDIAKKTATKEQEDAQRKAQNLETAVKVARAVTEGLDFDDLSYQSTKRKIAQTEQVIKDKEAELSNTGFFERSKRKRLKSEISSLEKFLETQRKAVSDYEAKQSQQQQAA
ncbi:hypothetical protein J6X13_02650 [Candidatus Saccharibacteria bacterium]|nr:hypothetical protein [Candidatus Saccharibacteria bacterium]